MLTAEGRSLKLWSLFPLFKWWCGFYRLSLYTYLWSSTYIIILLFYFLTINFKQNLEIFLNFV